ncbi:MAG: hypothetical protein Q7R39_12665, partial [Dehalococcoidia bacterium]|nr:hypothetical protein [Dehalococcoidia bacterium]
SHRCHLQRGKVSFPNGVVKKGPAPSWWSWESSQSASAAYYIATAADSPFLVVMGVFPILSSLPSPSGGEISFPNGVVKKGPAPS